MTNKTLEKRKTNGFAILCKSLLLFLYIYEFNFSAWGFSTFITSRRIVVFLLLGLLIIKSLFRTDGKRGRISIALVGQPGWKILRKHILMLLILVLQCIFLTLAYGQGTGTPFIEVLIRQMAFGVIPIFLFYEFFDSLDEFMMALLIATIIQGIIILLCLINPSVTTYIDSTFVQDSIARKRWGYAGGLACSTAPGCIKFSLGLIACMYFILTNNKSIYYFLNFFLSIIIMLIARTGAVFVAISLLFLLYALNKEGKASKAFNYVASSVIFLLLLFAILAYTGSLSAFSQRFVRYVNLIQNGAYDEFFSGFQSERASLPPLSQNLIGTGTVSGYSGNNQFVNIDGGYLRIYSAVGPIIAIICYISMFKNLIKSSCICSRNIKRLLLIFVAFIAVAEFKEFTIYAQFMFCIFYSAAFLAEREQLKYEQ